MWTTSRLLDLLRTHGIIFFVVVFGGLAAWYWSASSRPNRPLSLLQRVSLAVLLIGFWFCWSLADQALPSLGAQISKGPRRDVSDQLQIPPPSATSFMAPDWRTIEGRHVLLLQPPGRMEWMLEPDVAGVAISYGFDSTAYEKGTTNGADLILELVGAKGTRQIFARRLDPRKTVTDRGIQNSEVIFPAYDPGAKLVLRTEPGESGDAAWDWIHLAGFAYLKGQELNLRRYPGFNRAPRQTEGDNTMIFLTAEGKPYLFAAAPTTFRIPLNGNERTLKSAFGFLPSAYTEGGRTDGVIVEVSVTSKTRSPIIVWQRVVKPVENPRDRELLHATVGLPKTDLGDELVFRILPGANNSWDHTGLALIPRTRA